MPTKPEDYLNRRVLGGDLAHVVAPGSVLTLCGIVASHFCTGAERPCPVCERRYEATMSPQPSEHPEGRPCDASNGDSYRYTLPRGHDTDHDFSAHYRDATSAEAPAGPSTDHPVAGGGPDDLPGPPLTALRALDALIAAQEAVERAERRRDRALRRLRQATEAL